ncbi:hypothetical protein TrRE_jg4117 [Triparma retinervis]|uniref:Phosphoinositide phospholipase C n=1 Tax=Triparma retinervis TaxID=2557542 RepID=A0A9W6ZRI6_9STRA|nr:hypothetical protein TrRE_jg4117 [Triparma retinervis]
MAELTKSKDVAVPEVPNLLNGGQLTKLGRRGRPGKRAIILAVNRDRLNWQTTSFFKGANATSVDLTSVTRVTKGQSTIPFIRQEKNKAVTDKTELSFSIIYEDYNGNETSLDLICDSKEEFDTWYSEINEIVKYHNMRKDSGDRVLRFAKRQWSMADRDGDGSLDVKEIITMIGKLNINLDNSYIKKMFAEIDVDKSGSLDYMEFQALLERLSKREDIYATWAALVNGDIFKPNFSVSSAVSSKPNSSFKEAEVPAETFHRFLTDVQKMSITLDETKMKMAASKTAEDDIDGKMRFANFKDFLASAGNSAFSTEKTSSVYQDMNQPISHYWCASSHNTYCESDQLKGYSSVNRYINDLTKGCRCVELDCWDGPKGDPIIFHGHTLTGQIKFKDVIQAVKDHGFVTSQYPIILSFENHCSIKQQQKMASYCKSILGKLLYVPDLRSDGSLPSPEDCKGKVLVKAKRLPKDPKKEEGEEEVDEDFAEQQNAQEGEKAKSKDSADASDGPLKEDKKKKKKKIAPELSNITFLAGTHFKDWEKSKNEADSNEMSSFSEPKTEKLIGKSAAEWADYNKRQMSRIYPAGFRIDSSNYNPVPSWCVGSQIVALNYQTSCFEMHLNDGKYLDNGSAGYVLKPEALRVQGNNFNPMSGPYPTSESVNFKVEVMSASQLPKPGGSAKGEVIDPYIKVELHGVPSDSKSYKTKVVDNNGFNPLFNETFSFSAKMKSLGLLYVAVYDSDQFDSDDFIAYSTIPANCLQPGIRNINLRSYNGNTAGEFQFCSVMVNITLESGTF